MHMTMLRESHENQVDQQGHPNGERGLKLIRFESPRWRPKSSLSPPWNLGAVKWTLRTHPDSVFDDPYMDGKII